MTNRRRTPIISNQPPDCHPTEYDAVTHSIERTVNSVCSVGRTQESTQHGTAYFMEPNDTIPGINGFSESNSSTESSPFFL